MPKTVVTSPRIAALAAVAALAAAPAAASAADVVGSNFANPATSWRDCEGTPSCTVALDRTGFYPTQLPLGSVVTKVRVALSPNAQVRPRLLRRDEKDHFAPIADGHVLTGNAGGGVQDLPIHFVVGSASATIGLDLVSGAVGIAPDPDDVLSYAAFAPALGAGESRAASRTFDGDLLLAAVAEADWDEDGLGDESEDPCVRCDPTPPPADPGPPPADPAPGAPTTPTSPGGGAGGSGGGSAASPLHLTIDKRALLRGASAGSAGYVEVYADNDGKVDLGGTIQLKLGKKVLGTGEIDLEYGYDYSWGLFRLPKAELARLLKRGSLKATVVAKLKAADGRRKTVTQPVTILRGGALGYDGVYRGPGPVTLTVERGVVTQLSTSLFLMCTASNRSMTRAFYTPGFPTFVKRDGSFAGKESASADSMRWNGKLSRNGTARGYLSLWHTELMLGEGGKLRADQCFQAKNWSAKRSR